MIEAADALGSAWIEMWGRLWRIDTLFETGQLREVQRELTDLSSCLERVSGPIGPCHHMEAAATLALATGRFTEAARLARGAFKVLNDMGHPAAIGALAVILTQSALHVGLDRTGLAEVFDLAPAHVLPEAVDTTRGTATIFPALTVTLIRLHQGDRAGAEAAYALAGPVRSWTPMAAMRMAAWGHGLAIAIGLRRTEDIEFLLAKFEPFRGQHAANGAGSGVYLGPVELQLGLAAAALGRLDAAVGDLQAAASICDANGARGKHNPPQDIDGLLAWAAGSDSSGLNVVTIWQTQAHQERFAAEQLLPAFQEFGVAEHVMGNGEFTTYEAGELYIR